ncbi:MAG: hypothetical protein CUN51_01025 [Candidatus Thermofonsia Clade 1 bacterium]|uniref:Glycosyltransferase RgtA/B/C/D-like domain-containing protein n=1 Tax=Candidatus Thermofonsia Clade 1 bacterium TaxID=2364210 RepID=A0A2M8P3W8_9CHLR|nr:MAG: hypothetical protein CUN51_01025 [Candidatus Thermofonsia Clade 1 bacterium]
MLSAMRTHFSYRLYDGLIFTLVVAFFLLAPLPIFAYDDAYVYFNYARNFAEGRPFAYDPRNIPSEGFTSLLFMLLLVPAELLRLNPILASSLINILALSLAIVWLGQTVRAVGLLSERAAVLFTVLLAVLLIRDESIRLLIFSGFEAVLGILCAAGIVISAARALDDQLSSGVRRHWLSVFFVMTSLAHLVRPEYLLIGALGGALLLWRSPDRVALLRRTAIFVLVMAGYYLLKLAIFGDLFPTGFYRKVRASELGSEYVDEWLQDYGGWFLTSSAVFMALMILTPLRHKFWIGLLAASAASIVIFYTQTTPLAGVFHRFLVVPIWALYAIFSLGIAYMAFHLSRRLSAAKPIERVAKQQWLKNLALPTVLIALPALLMPSDLSLMVEGARAQGIFGLAKRARDAMNGNPYIQLGTYWREQLNNPATVMVAHVDAGALPYALGSRFLDLQGLTEPPIAHMFGTLNTPEAIQSYIEYVLRHEPDVVFLWSMHVPNLESTWHSYYDLHSPFLDRLPVALFEAYQRYGLVYGCSIELSWLRLHLLIRRQDGAQFSGLSQVFCSHSSARRFAEGLTVVARDGQVYFP